MSITVYFTDKTLIFTAKTPSDEYHVIESAHAEEKISRAKITQILENHNFVAVVGASPEDDFARFAADFTQVEAAGGVVVDASGRALMIHRNGRWDLPKGHLEQDESIERCAEREIEEETGVAARVVAPLCKTYHAYWFPRTERWELKRTHWYQLEPVADAALTPQTEEGIESVVWCDAEAVAANLRATFPTIREVFARLMEN